MAQQEKAMPDPLTQKARARKDALAREEEKFREARMEYETTGASILAVARSHNLKYEDLRLHIRMYHPESRPLHPRITSPIGPPSGPVALSSPVLLWK